MPSIPNTPTNISPTPKPAPTPAPELEIKKPVIQESGDNVKKINEQKTETKKEEKKIEETTEKTDEVKKVPTEETEEEEEEEEEEDEDYIDDRMMEQAVGTGMKISFLIVCLVVALIKDILEIILFLTGVGNLVSFVISVPLTSLLVLLLSISGTKSNFDSLSNTTKVIARIAPYLIDGIPVVSVLPISTILVIISFSSKKNSKKIKNLENKTGQAQNLLQKSEKTQEVAGKAKGLFSKFLSKV
jgi:hypothetical protein